MLRLFSAVLWGAALALTLPSGATAAEPTLEVRGRMRIRLEREQHTADGGLVVAGSLVEESLGEPMPGWTVALRITRLDSLDRETFVYGHAEPTDGDGGFHFVVPPLARAPHHVRLTGIGDTVYAAPPPVERGIDMSRRDLELRLHAPSEHPAATSTLPIVIEAVPLDPAQTLGDSEPPIVVAVDLEGRAMTTILLHGGRASTALALPSSSAGRELVLRVRFAGDEVWAPAEATARVRIVEPVKLLLWAEPPRGTVGDEIQLSGRLQVGARALEGASIVVRRVAAPEDPDDAPVATVKTDAQGAFHTRLRAPLRSGPASFEASLPAAEAKGRGLSPATSEIVVVEVVPGISLALLPRRPAGLALAISATLLLALGGLRARRAWRRRRGSATATLAPTTPPGPRKLFGTLRIARDRRVGGRVRDAEHGRPLAGARVQLKRGGDSAITVITDALGAFHFAEVGPGAIELVVELDGHVPSHAAGQVPHRGELAAIELSLMPLRGQLLRRYDEILAPFVTGERLGRRTPRELAEAALRHPRKRDLLAPPPPDAIRRLRALVEERCFGARPVGTEALAELERIAAPPHVGSQDPHRPIGEPQR